MSSTPVTPKGAATRAFLLQAAAEVFAERGYTETTMAELITRSGLTKGAFYFHFSSKEQLALAVIEEKQHQWIDSVQAAISAEPRAIDQLRLVARALVRIHRDDPSAFSVSRLTRDLSRIPHVTDLVRDHMRAWVGLLASLVSQAQADEDLPDTIEANDLAALLVAATDGLKDLGSLIDAPTRARRAFERRMNALIALVDALGVRPANAGSSDT
ncbi:TetR/AcrR family transcriptional regulator [Candidatus Mycolicibacterium alkanivorans]|uniref:TetR/AcrR family transcriptional regulator n=1 Tax=Candidatus Mycolicibacterium alkanivorans TaxID=2954114 RepID=A0ABS9YYU3_9MYCO|nr:TetR/AcrR family transcriptional regulator [Candidatus Mycolicibacterium alkanivorans]MCI4675888.1 TetR/AcrR family transcriptional regulator [Candidatus Mycolicibacterium alkanivorans]